MNYYRGEDKDSCFDAMRALLLVAPVPLPFGFDLRELSTPLLVDGSDGMIGHDSSSVRTRRGRSSVPPGYSKLGLVVYPSTRVSAHTIHTPPGSISVTETHRAKVEK